MSRIWFEGDKCFASYGNTDHRTETQEFDIENNTQLAMLGSLTGLVWALTGMFSSDEFVEDQAAKGNKIALLFQEVGEFPASEKEIDRMRKILQKACGRGEEITLEGF